ncbi:chromosome segregation protein SMC [Enterococcus sp. 2201sp1_2201st1_B8_2201SCRN_220225]|uniref:chromosome segregation protein SMC n=1 Tax=unclassified Enterococcus TaxID=2608891 RepID=UPI0034A1A9A3
MYLKKIEIAGFKSFADRTVIDFENSVTAVVGPNGSGKSNITEAIRWVLGEQSVKSLRGGKMPDIIFAGSDSRKALNIAEVTVVLDNSDHYLPLDYSEISVTRRFRRTGESDFFINKQACRLKDIQDLFMDSGLGKESFSIISQGKVEAIFASKPEDRRGIFEEAAGVLKYKQRKKKAEQKLFETEDNLSRVQDIVYELEDQLTPLAEQSRIAKKYLELKESLTKVDVAYTVTEIQEEKRCWNQEDQRVVQLNGRLEQISREIQEKEVFLQAQRHKRSSLDEWLENANQELLALTEALKQAEGQQALLAERSKNTLQSTKEYQQNIEAAQEQMDSLEEQISEQIGLLSHKNREHQELEEAIATQQAELVKYQRPTKEVLEDLRGQYVEKMQEHANIGNDLKYLERRYSQEAAKNQKALQKQEELTVKITASRQQKTQLSQQIKAATEELDQQRKDYLLLQEQAKTSKIQLDSEQKKMYNLMSQVQQTRAKEKSLQDIQENYAGFYQGPRMILKHRQELSGIVGAVAELLEVPADYALAIETALGASAQHILVENEQAARGAITFLKQQRGGRGTFLPLTTIQPRQVPQAQLQNAQQIEGFIGIAASVVQFPENISNVMHNLLGGILLAEDLQSANAIARSVHYRYRVVSLEGDVMNAGGSMTGGAVKKGNSGNLFSQGSELQQLQRELAQLDSRLQTTEAQVARLDAQTKEQQTQLESLRAAGETGRLALQELEHQRQTNAGELQRLEQEQSVFTFENREVQEFLAEYDEKRGSYLKAQKEVEAAREKINHDIQELGRTEDLIEAKREELSQSLAQSQSQMAVTQQQILHLKEQIQGKKAELTGIAERKASLELQLQALNSDFSSHEVTEESLEKQVRELSQKQEEIKLNLSQKRQQRSEVQSTISRGDESLSAQNQEQKTLLSQKTRAEVEKKRADIRLDTLLNYLQESYAMTFELALESYGVVAERDVASMEIANLKQRIEILGPVNLNAIDQFEQVNERYQFLVSQRDDLLQAKDQLFTTMSEMDEEVKVRFSEVFEAIRLKFKEVFPNMFGGGRAELLLTDPEDLLNTGIEIEAQPPGKKLQSLSLLSGGERALTAIALLFSIIQVRPVPFCVLDEVEAALDEANVTRFGSYLSRFQNDTQFIVVTHRKGTMEAADVLYGVTMQESGVSKIVSVRLEDVKEGGKIVATDAK